MVMLQPIAKVALEQGDAGGGKAGGLDGTCPVGRQPGSEAHIRCRHSLLPLRPGWLLTVPKGICYSLSTLQCCCCVFLR